MASSADWPSSSRGHENKSIRSIYKVSVTAQRENTHLVNRWLNRCEEVQSAAVKSHSYTLHSWAANTQHTLPPQRHTAFPTLRKLWGSKVFLISVFVCLFVFMHIQQDSCGIQEYTSCLLGAVCKIYSNTHRNMRCILPAQKGTGPVGLHTVSNLQWSLCVYRSPFKALVKLFVRLFLSMSNTFPRPLSC